MTHTPGPWKLNHFEHNSSSGLKCERIEDEITYFSADGVTEDFYQVVAEIDPMKHSIQGDFQGANICKINDFKCQDGGNESMANAKLITAAPDLLETLKRTYLELQTLVQRELNNGRVHLALITDSIRANLRNKICKATGDDCQRLQEEIESIAFEKAKTEQP